MRFKQAGNKADLTAVVVKNAESSATIPRGTPVAFKLSSTSSSDDGLAVVLPATALAAGVGAFSCGVTIASALINQFTEAIAYGVAPYCLIVYATRAASTNSWTSSTVLASGAILTIDTINNAFTTSAASVASAFMPYAVLLDSIASFAASATTTSDSRTALTTGVRCFLRFL